MYGSSLYGTKDSIQSQSGLAGKHSNLLTTSSEFVNSNLNGYQPSVPDYLRISADKLDKKKIKHPDRIGVISKTNGWLTVDSNSLSRVNAYEKMSHELVNRETSPLSPDWMQNVNK